MKSEYWRLVEVYGSLLNSKQRRKLLSEGGTMEEIGTVKRAGWKLSFDKWSYCRKEVVLNLVKTEDLEDVFHTTVFRVDSPAYNAILRREMGKKTAAKWRRGEQVPCTCYRPVQLDSEFGITDIFIIPKEGRVRIPSDPKGDYVNIVRKGIEESYEEDARDVNLRALDRAVEESQQNQG